MKLTQRIVVLGTLLMLLGFAAGAQAAVQNYAVMPFTVNGPADYKYLEKAIAPMFSSRLYRAGGGQFQPMSLNASNMKTVASDKEAQELQEKFKTGYLLWGTLTIKGNSSTLDVRVRDAAGNIWSKSTQGVVNNIIPQIQRMADSVATEVFKLQIETAAPARTRPAAAAQNAQNSMNPDILSNQTQPQQQVYMNPQFRYAGGEDTTLLRSQSLNFPGVSMEVGDVDRDGQIEVLILSERKVYAGRFENGRLNIIAEFPLSLMLHPINLRLWEDRNSLPKIIVNARDDRKDIATMMLTFDGKEFHVEHKKIPYYLNVLRTPPDYVPVLLGQDGDMRDPFRPGIYEMTKTQSGFEPGRRLKMPEFAKLFAIDWLPDMEEGDKFLMLTDQERLRLYTEDLKMLAETDEKYSGSSVGIELNDSPFGQTSANDGVKNYYHVPIRMIVNDLDGDGKSEVIVLRPISTASQIFTNYRTFPQGEIQSLFWDGLGMSLKWKTRRIKGTIVDFNFADVNNDGRMYLVVLVNSHPGALGLSNRRAMVLAYPLDLSKTDPNTPPSVTE